MSQTDEDVENLPTDTETEPESEPQTETTDETAQESNIDAGESEQGGTDQDAEQEPEQEAEEGAEEQEVEEQPAEEQESEIELATVEDEQAKEEQGEEEEGEEEVEEEEPSFYDSDDFISGPKLVKGGTLPLDILEFDFSYSYSCRKYFNLEALDENIVVFSSGNYINFLNVETKEIWFRRSALGGGLGNIKKNPKEEYPYFAVAECGRRPIIIMYEWPTLDIHCLLKGGSARIYTNMDFSPDGELLVSQGGEPDHMITIWNWREHKIILRCKSNVNDVFRVKFSPYVPGQLTSSGLAHIKFWKMAITFTGLKLKGELGRFGKTEYSDILGVLPMPDEKVLSGCSWGNILVWDGGLISLEVFRTLRRTCHDGPIVQLSYNDGELWTVSMDGHIRVWWYEKIDQADPPDDDRVVLLDPSYDFYTPGVMLMSIVKRHPHDPTKSVCFGQDGNGGIWLIDLNTEEEPEPSVQLYKCHAGEIADIAACPYGPYLASLGKDGRLYVYQYLEKKRVFDYDFPAKGVCMIWLPLEIQNTGDVILAAFEDGQIRVCSLTLTEKETFKLILMQVIKPHNKPVTIMSVNPSGTILVSGGEDRTIFIFKLNTQETENFLVPIGFIPSPEIATCITWHYANDAEVLVGCMRGKMMQVVVPYQVQPYTGISYLLDLSPKYNVFKTYKSQIRRDIKIKEIEERKAKKLARKMEELEKVKKENPGLEIDEDAFLADSEGEEELEPLHIPEVPNKIMWLKYTDDKTIWLSMGGFDAGYIYEYLIDQKDDAPYRFQMIYNADDIEISSYVYSKHKDYLIFAMQDGSMRLNRVKKDDFRDLSDYWIMTMHDNQDGFVPKMCFSFDEQYFFSCGHDGNVFSYKFQPEDYTYPDTFLTPIDRWDTPLSVRDVDPYIKLSLEETKIKAENDRIQKFANEQKAKAREVLKNLKQRYGRILTRNAKLLPSQVISRDDLELDPRLTEQIDGGFTDKLNLVKRKLAYDLEKSEVQMLKLLRHFTDPVDKHPITVYGINKPDLVLMTVRQRKMSPKFYDVMKIIDDKLVEEEHKGRPPERAQPLQKSLPPRVSKPAALEYFLLSLSPSVIQTRLGPKLSKLLNKYRQRMLKWDRRLQEWEEFYAKKPVSGRNHPDDEKFFQEAKDTIGDYKLKESPDYKVPRHLRETTVKKYKQVLATRLKQYLIRHDFSQKVWDIRDKKYLVRDHLSEKRNILLQIHEELPESLQGLGPNIPDVDMLEFPENKLTPNVVLKEETASEEMEMQGQPFIEQPDGDKEERELLPERDYFPPVEDETFHSSLDDEVVNKVGSLDFHSLLHFPENNDTPYEMDIRVKRLNRKVFDQNQTIISMNKEIEEFNDLIVETKKERLPIHVSGNFIDLYILTLNQELNILKQSEDNEDRLSEKVNDCLRVVHEMEDLMDALKHKQEIHEAEIENCQIEAGKIQDKFKHAAENNKFYDFLRKVFKKKYKPPKVSHGDDSSSESSSSSSSESEADDAASIDSRDFGIIRQDLNVCPKGCEQAIFNLTIDLRSKRHELEQAEREHNRLLEIVKKDVELNTRKMNMLQKNLQTSTNDLEAFQREKQRKLNQVNCTVVLYLDQMYGFNPGTSDIADFLVFSKTTLSNLYKRVGILQQETYEQKSKYDTYLKHLMRMKKDLNYMKRRIKELVQEHVDVMKTKFGQIIDISEIEAAIIKKSFKKSQVNELEEVMLKKMVYDLRIKSTDIKHVYTAELNAWKTKIHKCQNELIETIKENTKRLDLLKILNKEKKELTEILDQQPYKKIHVAKIERTFQDSLKEVAKFEEIIEEQCRELHDLKSEIKMLKTKGLPPRTPREEVKVEVVKEIIVYDETAKEWTEYGEYFGEDDKPFATEITLPGYYSTETQDIVTDLVSTLLENVDSQLERKSTENMVKNILSGILKCSSATDVINEIISNLSFEPTEEQKELIESTADQLFAIQEPEVTEETFEKCAGELLEDIIDDVMLTKGQPHEVIAKMVEKLILSLPLDFLMEESTIRKLVGKLAATMGDATIGKEDLAKVVDGIPSIYRDEMMAVLDIILERVYGTGIDYLYVIKL